MGLLRWLCLFGGTHILILIFTLNRLMIQWIRIGVWRICGPLLGMLILTVMSPTGFPFPTITLIRFKFWPCKIANYSCAAVSTFNLSCPTSSIWFNSLTVLILLFLSKICLAMFLELGRDRKIAIICCSSESLFSTWAKSANIYNSFSRGDLWLALHMAYYYNQIALSECGPFPR